MSGEIEIPPGMKLKMYHGVPLYHGFCLSCGVVFERPEFDMKGVPCGACGSRAIYAGDPVLIPKKKRRAVKSGS